MTGSSGFGNDTSQLVDLALCPTERTEPALGQFSGLLVLRVSDQFHHPTFVWGEASDLTDDGADKGGALRGSSLEVRWLVGQDARGGFVARVEASRESCSGRSHSG